MLLIDIFLWGLSFFVLLVLWIIFYGLDGGFEERWWSMTYEEEMDWLMNEQGLTYEEAKEIVEIPHRTLAK